MIPLCLRNLKECKVQTFYIKKKLKKKKFTEIEK